MPKIFSYDGYVIYFYVSEGEPLENVYVHYGKDLYDKSAKAWINSDGTVSLEYNKGIPLHKMNKLLKITEAISDDICDKWYEHFGEITYKDSELGSSYED